MIIWWLVWAGWYAFGEYIGVKFDNKILKIFMDFVTNVSFLIPYEGIVFISETPQIKWENKKLHNLEGKSVEYADGYGMYNIYGVSFDEKTYKKVTNPRVTAKTILSLENIEQRMAMIKVKGSEWLIKATKAKRLGKKSKKGNELYLVKDVFNVYAYFLRYECPSTGRIYFSGVDAEVGETKDADTCMAWKFQMTKDEYLSLEIES
jgi:uncharacterized small protein (DUF1192 family)